MKFETMKKENYSTIFFSMKLPFGQTFRISSMLYKSPNEWVHGYSSRTEEGKYVLFMDFDALDFQTLKHECRYLQKKFNLSNFYIFKLDRKDSWHGVCLDTFCLSDAYLILKQSSCDTAFINAITRFQNREWVLRIGKKGERGIPEFFGCLKSEEKEKHVKSLAHKEFLIKAGVPKHYFVGRKWDGLKTLTLIDYTTANRTI